MVNEIKYIRLEVVLDRILKHPLLQDITYEAAIQYTVDFLNLMGFPKMFIEKQACLEIKDYRAVLPCDLVTIIQVKHGNTYLRSMTSAISDNNKNTFTFKTQGNVIYTSFKEGTIDIYYRAIPIDENEVPLIPDHPVFLKALELYIKNEWFTILFDMGKINQQVMQNTQQQYAFQVAQCNTMFITPSVAEMQTITNMLNQMIPRQREFEKGFKTLGVKENLRTHG